MCVSMELLLYEPVAAYARPASLSVRTSRHAGNILTVKAHFELKFWGFFGPFFAGKAERTPFVGYERDPGATGGQVGVPLISS